MVYNSNMIDFIKEWQTLIGAAIGASMPVLFWFFVEWRRRKRERIEGLYYLERILVNSINSLIDTHSTVVDFLEGNIEKTIENIQENMRNHAHSVDFTFFPLFEARLIDENLLKIKTGSGYIDNKIADVFRFSKDFFWIMEDVRRQFENSTKIQYELALTNVNPTDVQGEQYIRNLKSFKEFVERDVLNKNIKNYIKVLMEARIAVIKLRKIGLLRWKIRFSKFWILIKKIKKSDRAFYDVIEEFFEDKVSEELKELDLKS